MQVQDGTNETVRRCTLYVFKETQVVPKCFYDPRNNFLADFQHDFSFPLRNSHTQLTRVKWSNRPHRNQTVGTWESRTSGHKHILNVVLGKFYHEVSGVAWIIDSMWMCKYVERTEQGQENHFHHPKLHRTFKKQTNNADSKFPTLIKKEELQTNNSLYTHRWNLLHHLK